MTDEADTPGPRDQPFLGQITTSWTSLHDPVKFVMTYGPAIRTYVLAIVRHEDDAEDVLQNLLLQVVQKGFARASPDRGRFRDYLKAVVRHAAWAHLRRRQAAQAGAEVLEQLAEESPQAEETWVTEWRQCVLDKAWRALERHEHASASNLGYTVMRLAVEHPDEDSSVLASRAAQRAGRPLSPEAFRQQLSRARRRFAELIVDEIRQTLEEPTPGQVQEELAELGLLEYLRAFLPRGDG